MTAMTRGAALSLLAMMAIACGRRPESAPPRPQAAIAASRTFPENYVATIDDAWRGDSLAVDALFGYEDQQAFTGEAATEHRQLLWALLQHLGDSGFAAIARPELPRVRGVVLRALEEASHGSVDARFPATYNALAMP